MGSRQADLAVEVEIVRYLRNAKPEDYADIAKHVDLQQLNVFVRLLNNHLPVDQQIRIINDTEDLPQLIHDVQTIDEDVLTQAINSISQNNPIAHTIVTLIDISQRVQRWQSNDDLPRKKRFFIIPICLGLCFLVGSLVAKYTFDLESFGVHPREIWTGLPAVTWYYCFSSVGTFFASLVPFVIFSSFILKHSAFVYFFLTFFSAIAVGLAFWVFADPNTVLLGQNGILFAQFSFLMVKNVELKNWIILFFLLLTMLLYSTGVLLLFPEMEYTSWIAHVSGVVFGILCGIPFFVSAKSDMGTDAENQDLLDDYEETWNV